jgi:hypothetical protein
MRGGAVTLSRLERYAPLTGVLAVVLWVIGVIVAESAEDPSDDASPAEYLAYFQDNEGAIYIGTALLALGVVAYIWFLGCLRTTLADAEGGRGRLGTVALVFGAAQGVLLTASSAPQVAGAIAAEDDEAEMSGEAAEALWWIGDGFFLMASLMLIGLFLATAVVILRTRVFPVWLGWVSIVLAIGLLILPIGWAIQIFLTPLWIVLVSILMYRRWARAEPVAAAA